MDENTTLELAEGIRQLRAHAQNVNVRVTGIEIDPDDFASLFGPGPVRIFGIDVSAAELERRNPGGGAE